MPIQEPAHGFSDVREATYEAEPALVDLPLAGLSAPVDEAARGPVGLPEEIRPRSRLREAGAEALCAAELLAVLLCAFPGTNEEGALDLAIALLMRRDGLHGLLRSSPREISGVAGIGEAKASSILAAAELGKRMVLKPAPQRPVISAPGDVDRLLRGRMAHLDRERFVVVLLLTRHQERLNAPNKTAARVGAEAVWLGGGSEP